MTKRIPKRLYAVVDQYGPTTFITLKEARQAKASWSRAFPSAGAYTIATYALVKPVGRKGRKKHG